MPDLSNDLIPKIFKLIKHALSVFLLIAVFSILQYIFNMHFVCSCKEGLHLHGVLYMIVPPLILIFVVNIAEPFHRRKIFSSQRWFSWSYKKSFCSYMIKMIIKLIGLTAVWIAAVLFDGDWYICLMTNYNSAQTGIPCREKLTYDEVLIKNQYKDESLMLGLAVICGFLLLWSICEIRAACCISKGCRPYYSVVYEELLAEQVSERLNDGLEKIATDKAEAICKPYLEAIRNHELRVKNRTDDAVDKILKSWERISSTHFYSMDSDDDDPLLAVQCNGIDTPDDFEADFYTHWFFG